MFWFKLYKNVAKYCLLFLSMRFRISGVLYLTFLTFQKYTQVSTFLDRFYNTFSVIDVFMYIYLYIHQFFHFFLGIISVTILVLLSYFLYTAPRSLR